MTGWLAVACAVAGAIVVHLAVPWIPGWYLAALIGLPVVFWWSVRSRRLGAWRRGAGVSLAGLGFVALCPVPWMKAALTDPPGTAWPLDGQLSIAGVAVDPPGSWYWLTAGRPPVVAEVVRSWIVGHDDPVNMHGGRRAQRPEYAEPAAAFVGLRRAGWRIDVDVVVEVSEPIVADLPGRALLAAINGSSLTDRGSWDRAVAALVAHNTVTTTAGESFAFDGSVMPFRRVDVIERPVGGVDIAIGGRWADVPPVSWFRDLSVGSSHGLMVALVSYVHASGVDLADGRTIAGTGGIRPDGTVRRIGDLRSKATAARDIGADVMLFPASQASDLDGFDPGSMQLVPVATIDEAIKALRARTA